MNNLTDPPGSGTIKTERVGPPVDNGIESLQSEIFEVIDRKADYWLSRLFPSIQWPDLIFKKYKANHLVVPTDLESASHFLDHTHQGKDSYLAFLEEIDSSLGTTTFSEYEKQNKLG